MKKLMLLLLLLPLFVKAQLPQNDRWKLLAGDANDNKKVYIDTQTVNFNNYFEGQRNVYLVCIRTYSDSSNGQYTQFDDQHMAISMYSNKIGVTSVVNHKDGNVANSQQFLTPGWIDIVPESLGEIIFNYCKNLKN